MKTLIVLKLFCLTFTTKPVYKWLKLWISNCHHWWSWGSVCFCQKMDQTQFVCHLTNQLKVDLFLSQLYGSCFAARWRRWAPGESAAQGQRYKSRSALIWTCPQNTTEKWCYYLRYVVPFTFWLCVCVVNSVVMGKGGEEPTRHIYVLGLFSSCTAHLV